MKRPTKPTVIPPPDHLSERAKQLWSSVVPRRAASPERLALLLTALEALDRADEASRVLAAEGMTLATKRTGAVHVHPAVKIENDAHKLFASIWGKLNLEFAPSIDGRLGG